MSKIGDLFVRLGLKKDDFDKGLKDSRGKLDGFVKAMKTFGGAVSTVMSVAAAAIAKFAKDAIALTQKWGDQWAVTVAGIQGAYQAFVRQISSGEGWDNLFANMKEAARVARETAAALDELFERKLSFSYEEAETEREIARLQNIMRDSSKSDAERKKAAEDIIALEEKLGNLRKDIAQQEADAYRDNFRAQTHLQDEQIDFLLKEYNTNRDIINQGRRYLEDKAKYERDSEKLSRSVSGAGANDAVRARTALQQLEANTSQAVKDVAELIKNYDKSSDDLVAKLVNAEVAVINVDTAVARAQSRATSTLGSLNKDSGGSRGADPQAAQAAAILKRAEDSAKSEIQLLYEKYQTEKALLEQYGIDTYALTDEYFRNLQKIMEKGLDDAFKPLEDLEPIEVEPIEINWEEIDAEAEAGMMEIKKLYEQGKALADGFGQAVATGFADACEELASQLMGLEEINGGAIIKALLTPLADLAVKTGEIIIAEGVAVEAAKKALETFAGVGAIAAGIALVAIGSAAKAGLAALAKGGSATTSVATSGYSGSMGSGRVQDLQTELVITVEGRLSGSDIVLSGQRTMDNWSR